MDAADESGQNVNVADKDKTSFIETLGKDDFINVFITTTFSMWWV